MNGVKQGRGAQDLGEQTTGGNLLAVGVLTFNSETIIAETIAQAKKVSSLVVVVDSYSSDRTVAIAQNLGARVLSREFSNYSEQRNWLIEQLNEEVNWQLHLDADEVLDDIAVDEINRVVERGDLAEKRAYLLRRKTYFMSQPLRFGGAGSYHLRLFPSRAAQCENRLYDQHFVSDLPASRLKGAMLDKNTQSLDEWVARHNRWSTLEAEELISGGKREGVVRPALFGNAVERRRFWKLLYYRFPPALRSPVYFLYRYFFQLGFLDGRVGFYYAVFQVLWFRSLVDAKVAERKRC